MGAGLTEVRIIFLEEVRRGLRRPWYRISTLGVPVILLVLMAIAPLVRGIVAGSASDGDANGGRFGIVDQAGIVTAEDVAAAPGLRLLADREAGIAALLAGQVTALFIVTTDYLQTGAVERLHTRGGISAEVSSEGGVARIQDLLRRALIKDGLSDQQEARFLAPAVYESYVVADDGSLKPGGGEEAGFLSVSYIFAFLLMFATFTGSGYLLESVADEKENRMIEVVLTSASPMGVMTGKVLGMGAIGLLQIVVWGLSVVFIGARTLSVFPEMGQLTVDPVLVVWAVLFFLAGYFLLGVIMAGIGAAAGSYREGSQISLLVLLPAAVPIWFFLAIAGNPDGTLARVLSFIPFTAPITMMLRLGAAEVAPWETVASLAVTATSGAVLLVFSARVFRAGLLLYGQRMSLGRVLRALRESA